LYNYGRASTSGVLIPKGPQGVKLLLDSLKKGKHLGVLMDQKMNDGIPVPFFGIEAMTASAIAELALRFDCPMVPVHIKRLGGVKFRIIFEAPLVLERTGNHVDDVQSLMIQVNNKIEGWIKAVPEQWLWLHNRWPD
jgi:KDO2-lipid IV(A) lauroyltransferase